MADALLSAAADRIFALMDEQVRYHVNLVSGAEKEVLSLANELNTIRNVLNDAENRRFQDKNINAWLWRLQQASYEMEDVLDEWDYAILKLRMGDDDVVARASKKKVCSFIPSSSCLYFKKVVVRHEIGRKITYVKEKLDEIFKEKDRYGFLISQPIADPLPQSRRIQSTSLIDLGEIHGRDIDGDILVSKLLANSGSREESGIQVLSIVGVGGLGKTTLAQLAYNHSRVEKSFDMRIWICVSDPFDLTSIAKGILESVGKCSFPSPDQLDPLLKRIEESILGKRFLLVLDDVWTEDYNKWEPLKISLRCGGAGSKILVTSRSERVVKMMGTRDSEIFRPGFLSDEDCWLLLCRMSLSGRITMEFEDISKKIAKKCNGLPLAAKTLGSLLRFKGRLEEWENVLKSEIWNMVEAEVELFPHLLLSYNELSPTLKCCFSYCAVFRKDSIIDVECLIRKWIALGYLGSNIGEMELKGQECFDVLAMRSLFQDFKKNNLGEIQSCKMHSIVHDFAKFLRKGGRVEASEMNHTTCQECDPSLVSTVNEFCSLYCNKITPRKICDCLIRLRVLSLKSRWLQSIPQGMENLIHLRCLNLVRINKLACEGLKIIFQLYNLQTLALTDCGLEEIPREIENLIHLRYLNLSGHGCLRELPREIGNLIHLRRLVISDNVSLKELPKEIGNLINLRCLVISDNVALKKLPKEIGNLMHLRSLNLSANKSLKDLPREIWNLIQLRYLDLSQNAFEVLPSEIRNLIHLRYLNLKQNVSLKELPSEIGNLTLLRYLDLSENMSLKDFPESICDLQELETLDLYNCTTPVGLAQLTSLRSLGDFNWGSDSSKLGLLKSLNHLGGCLKLHIKLDTDGDLVEVVEEARKAELRNKMHLERLDINFEDFMDRTEESSSVRMDVIDALQPHPNLREVVISNYRGSELPLSWIVSPLNQLREVHLRYSSRLTSLPPLGRLPCLENITIQAMYALEIVGREFLGVAKGRGGETLNTHESASSNTNVIAFPKLKILRLWRCYKLKEWEDITEEEEESSAFKVMPCLTLLEIACSPDLTALPLRLLRKATSLKTLNVSSTGMQRYASPVSSFSSISHDD